jgi:AhpD family alkylhydroperoxidase
MFKVMANSPSLLQGYLQLSIALQNGKLPPKTRHRLAVLIAHINGCNYCESAHTAMAKASGLSDDDLAKARMAQSDDAKTAAGLVFAKALQEKIGNISDIEWKAVKEAGYTDEEVMELVGAVALNFLTNIFNISMGTEIDFPLVKTR